MCCQGGPEELSDQISFVAGNRIEGFGLTLASQLQLMPMLSTLKFVGRLFMLMKSVMTGE